MSDASDTEQSLRFQLEKLHRRSDQAISAHCFLRDRYRRYADLSTLLLLLTSSALTALSLTSDALKAALLPARIPPDSLLTLLGAAVLLLTIADMHFGWRQKQAGHGEAASSLSRLKLILGRELGSGAAITKNKLAEMKQAYDNVNDLIVPIPERKFLQLKARHLRKVAISRHLDTHPGASIVLLQAKIWARDNLGIGATEKS